MYPEHLQKYIPPDFDLAKYDGTSRLNASEWLSNLTARWTDWGDKNDVSFHFAKDIHSVSLNIQYGCKREILKPRHGRDVKIITNNLAMHTRFELDPINNINLGFIDWAGELIRKHPILSKDIEYGKRIVDSLFSQDGLKIDPEKEAKLAEPAAELLNTLGEKQKGYLSVDLTSEDPILMHDFKLWLKAERERQDIDVVGAGKFFSPSKLRSWHDYRILQYLDVVQWQELNQIESTVSILSQIIYPERTDTRDKVGVINESTKRYVKEALSESTIKILFKQSLAEALKRK